MKFDKEKQNLQDKIQDKSQAYFPMNYFGGGLALVDGLSTHIVRGR